MRRAVVRQSYAAVRAVWVEGAIAGCAARGSANRHRRHPFADASRIAA